MRQLTIAGLLLVLLAAVYPQAAETTTPLPAPEVAPGAVAGPETGEAPTAPVLTPETAPLVIEPPMPVVPTVGEQRRELRDLRIAKASQIVRAGYSYGDERDFLPYVPYLIDYHTQLERNAVAKGKPAHGYADAWWWTLVYGGANFSLKCYRRAPGKCVGPLDVKGKRGSIDPKRNIQYHCQEMLEGYIKGYRDLGLCRYVMKPSAPTDWGGGMFRKTNARHLTLLKGYYSACIGGEREARP